MPSTPEQITPASNVYLNALQWGGWRWTDGAPAGTNITYYFGPAGVDLTGVHGAGFGNSIAWLSYQQTAVRNALQQWANVANITFTEVFSYSQADLVEHVYDNASSTTLGRHEGPALASLSDGTAWGAFNVSGSGFTSSGLLVGGYGFLTLVHELGHALGLAHPHDNGGGSGVFPGVTPGDSSDRGDNDLNQGIFTVMSYIDGWPLELGSSASTGYPSYNYSWQSGPMAFDIAAIQYLYGANTTYHSGTNNYLLGHVSGFPDVISCIWDTGGTDSITYGGIYDCTIDLRAATLLNEIGGGGFVSYVHGAPTSSLDHWNAFTIANGVVIENATGGSGNDLIYLSNQNVSNLVNGIGGSDTVYVTYSYGSGYTIQAGSTATNLVMLGSGGTDTFQNVEYVHFADGTTVTTESLLGSTPTAAPHDFNNDGTSDILIRHSTGYIAYGQMNNSAVTAWRGITGLATDWQVVDVGDFDVDGRVDDILIRHSTGYLAYGQTENGVLSTWRGIAELATDWQVVGVGDFDVDGRVDDILIRHSTGYLAYGQTENGVLSTWRGITGLATDWQVVGVGDFDVDGRVDDILIRHSTGYLAYGQTENGVLSTWRGITGLATDWQVAGVGDYDGDTRSDDILIRHSTGYLAYGPTENGVLSTWRGLTGLATDWVVIT